MMLIYLIILSISIYLLISKKTKEGYNRDGKIKVYCINRLSRPDRREKFLERIKKHLNLDVEIIDAVDKENLKIDTQSKLKPGETGCYLSHIEALLRLLSTEKS